MMTSVHSAHDEETGPRDDIAVAARVLASIWAHVVARCIALSDAVTCALEVAERIKPLVMVTSGSNEPN